MRALAVVAAWVLCGLLLARLTAGRGREGMRWWVLGGLLGPLTLLAAAWEGRRHSSH